jgi:hypothetical protein
MFLSYERLVLTPNHVFLAIERQNRSRRLGCAGMQDYSIGKGNLGWHFRPSVGELGWSDYYQIWHTCQPAT